MEYFAQPEEEPEEEPEEQVYELIDEPDHEQIHELVHVPENNNNLSIIETTIKSKLAFLIQASRNIEMTQIIIDNLIEQREIDTVEYSNEHAIPTISTNYPGPDPVFLVDMIRFDDTIFSDLEKVRRLEFHILAIETYHKLVCQYQLDSIRRLL